LSAKIEIKASHIQLVDSIDKGRIVSNLEHLSTISDPAFGQVGVTRLAYSETDNQGKKFIAQLMKDAGLDVRVSPIGNTFGRLAGSHSDERMVLTGSHTDSVIRGGRFDGIVGVVCAIEALRVLGQVKDELAHPIEVIDFVMEESARFGMSLLGSKAFMGEALDESTLLLKDSQGVSIAEALQEAQLQRQFGAPKSPGSPLEKAMIALQQSRGAIDQIRAYVELHVEQAGFLEEEGIPIGLVNACAMPTRWAIEIVGEQAHSGTTPMARRRNALVAASEFVVAVDKLCKQEAARGTVGAITKLSVEPNAMNTVPGKCSLFLDLRSTDKQSKDTTKARLLDKLEEICSRNQVTYSRTVITEEDPKVFSPNIVAIQERICDTLKVPHKVLPSRAGHDACTVSNHVKEVGMIFVPSKAGVSHHHEEWTDADQIVLGTKILLLTLLELATSH